MGLAVVRVRQGLLPPDEVHHALMGEEAPKAEIVFGGRDGEALRLDAVVAVESFDFMWGVLFIS